MKPCHKIFLFHDGISAITEPFTNFSFSQWNLGYHGAFSRIFLSHDGILAITEPLTNFSFSQWNLVFHGTFSRTFFSRWNLGYQGDLSHDKVHRMHRLGEDSFHIYHKEYLHRTCLVKNLASWFRAPVARKRVRSFLFLENCEKGNIFVPETTYRFVVRFS
jgi:hypothetical protein